MIAVLYVIYRISPMCSAIISVYLVACNLSHPFLIYSKDVTCRKCIPANWAWHPQSIHSLWSILNLNKPLLMVQVAMEIALHRVLERTSNILKGCRAVLDIQDLDDSDVNTARALERVCEVAERIFELAS